MGVVHLVRGVCYSNNFLRCLSLRCSSSVSPDARSVEVGWFSLVVGGCLRLAKSFIGTYCTYYLPLILPGLPRLPTSPSPHLLHRQLRSVYYQPRAACSILPFLHEKK